MNQTEKRFWLAYPNAAAMTLAGTPTGAGNHTLHLSGYNQPEGRLPCARNAAIKNNQTVDIRISDIHRFFDRHTVYYVE